VATAYRRARYYSERDAEGEGKANLKNVTEEGNRQSTICIDCEGADSSDTRKHIKEDARRFGHAFSEAGLALVEAFIQLPEAIDIHARAFVLKVEFLLAHRLWRNDTSCNMVLENI
jgi:hypothetical protein